MHPERWSRGFITCSGLSFIWGPFQFFIACFTHISILCPTTSHNLSPLPTTSHHLPPPLTTSHHLSPPPTTSHHLSPPTTSLHLSPPIYHLSPPLTNTS